jgi:hypothetical protein
MERQLLFDVGHPDAFRTTGKFHTAVLDEHDFALNRAAFAESGYSRGNFYNTYCNGCGRSSAARACPSAEAVAPGRRSVGPACWSAFRSDAPHLSSHFELAQVKPPRGRRAVEVACGILLALGNCRPTAEVALGGSLAIPVHFEG